MKITCELEYLKSKMIRCPITEEYNISYNNDINSSETLNQLVEFIETDSRTTNDERWRLKHYIKLQNIIIPNA